MLKRSRSVRTLLSNTVLHSTKMLFVKECLPNGALVLSCVKFSTSIHHRIFFLITMSASRTSSQRLTTSKLVSPSTRGDDYIVLLPVCFLCRLLPLVVCLSLFCPCGRFRRASSCAKLSALLCFPTCAARFWREIRWFAPLLLFCWWPCLCVWGCPSGFSGYHLLRGCV